MTPEAPLRIGISARLMHVVPAELGFRNKTLQYLEQSVAHWTIASGALAFMIPTLETGADIGRTSVRMGDYVRSLDGLILQGGADVSPMSYGEQPLRPEWAGDRVRDLYEIEMLWEFVIQKKPVLGICRGCQLMNVALGGSLYQDLQTQIDQVGAHVDSNLYDQLAHDVEFTSDGILEQWYGGERGGAVTSIHHQAVKKLGKDLIVEARSMHDGVIEAIRWKGSSFAIGVQWHPEFHHLPGRKLLAREPLMNAFLDEARRRRADRA